MPKREYYSRWVNIAFRGAPKPIDLWSGMVGAVLHALAHFVPAVQSAMPDLTWQLPFWIAGAIVLSRLVLTPYWIAQKDAEKIAQQQKEIDALKHKLRRQILITGIGDETEPAQAKYWTTRPAIRTVRIEVTNTGADILQDCLVTLENLTSDKGHIHKWEKAELGRAFTLRAGERIYIKVATLDETNCESEILLHINTFQILNPIPRNDTYSFNLVAYSVGSPDTKGYKLFVDSDGRLTMEESR